MCRLARRGAARNEVCLARVLSLFSYWAAECAEYLLLYHCYWKLVWPSPTNIMYSGPDAVIKLSIPYLPRWHQHLLPPSGDSKNLHCHVSVSLSLSRVNTVFPSEFCFWIFVSKYLSFVCNETCGVLFRFCYCFKRWLNVVKPWRLQLYRRNMNCYYPLVATMKNRTDLHIEL